MKRVIKFRGKRIDNGAWETGCAVVLRQGLRGEEWFISDKMTGYHTSVRRSTVGQFTGMQDRNGKEIYEGDIVKFHFMNSDPCTTKLFPTAKFFGEITTNKYNQWAIFSDGMEIHIENATEHGEVIGNIYDNPELLKGGQNGQTAE